MRPTSLTEEKENATPFVQPQAEGTALPDERNVVDVAEDREGNGSELDGGGLESTKGGGENPVERNARPLSLVSLLAESTEVTIAGEIGESSKNRGGIGFEYDEDDSDDQSEPIFNDHFSLGVPSSTVRFRNARYILYSGGEDQFVLEDRRIDDAVSDDAKGSLDPNRKIIKKNIGRHIITMRRVQTGTFGLRLLRSTYTLAGLLVLGFLFVFCFQVILFLFLNMPADGGGTSSKIDVHTLTVVGTLLSVPIFLFGMASIMAIGGTFVEDTWKGHPLFQSMIRSSSVATEWICFIVFLGIPSCALVVTLLSGIENWWEITATTSVSCIFFFMAIFALCILCCEIGACFEIIRLYMNPNDAGKSDSSGWRGWVRLCRRAVLLTETMFYSGERRERFLVDGEEEDPYSLLKERAPVEISLGLYSRSTMLSCCSSKLGIFDKLDPPLRTHTLEDIRDATPFSTRQNWSLEKTWCRNPKSRRIVAHSGPDALQPGQIISSVACTFLGALLIVLIVAGLFAWFDFSARINALISLLIAVCCLLPIVTSSLQLYRSYYKSRKHAIVFTDASDIQAKGEECFADEKGADEKIIEGGRVDQVSMAVWKNVRISQPRPWFCWLMLSLEIIFLFVWPLVNFYANNNWRIGNTFLFLGIFSGLRLYFNAASVLTEVGSLNEVSFLPKSGSVSRNKNDCSTAEPEKRWSPWSAFRRNETEEEMTLRKKARISEIVWRISRGRKTYRWMWVFAVFVLVIFLMAYSAFNQDDFDYKYKGVTLASGQDFHYPSQTGIQYPSCQLTKGFTLPGQSASALMDFAFLAAMAYAGPEESTILLDSWFGPGKVVDEWKFVEQYRNDTNTRGGVSYKLYSFADYPGYGVVGIRGSEKLLDWVVDIQLWSAAALAQLVRAFIPLGWIWTPILDKLVYIVNSIESTNLKKVSYYTRTTQFVNDLQSGTYGDGRYHTLRVTGASLGGGLSIITGAQTGAYTVSISGLNAMLSRRTFDPPITEEQLNTRVFNVIPDRDLIAKIDDRAQLFQETQCRAPLNSIFGCHSMWRSVCELSYQCGSGGRPILCWCVTKYGYPEPVRNGTGTWREACASEYEDKR